MRIRLIAIAAGLALSAPLAAFADNSAVTAQPVSLATQANPVVCHYYYYEGMLVRRPDCRPQHQWDRRRLEMRRYIEEFQLRALGRD